MEDPALDDAARTALETRTLPAVRVHRNYSGDIGGAGCPLCGSMMKRRDFLADIPNSMGVVTVHFGCFRDWQSVLIKKLTRA